MKQAFYGFLCVAALLLPPAGEVRAQEKPRGTAQQIIEAENHWKVLVEELPTLNPPPEWQQKEPAEEVVKEWIPKEGERLMALGQRLHDFAKKYPFHNAAGEAWKRATAAYFAAAQLHFANANERLAALDAERLAMPEITEAERFQIRLRQVQFESSSKVEAALKEVEAAGLSEKPEGAAKLEAAEGEAKKIYIEGARALMKDFPKQEEPYAMLLEVSGEGSTPEGKALLEALADLDETPQGVRARAQAILKQLAMLGQPLELKFTALDERKVDLAQMKGKVVLIEFWATWSGSSMQVMPELKKKYDELRRLGFEVLGVSFDKDRDRLEAYVKENNIPWPQYFDGKEWENAIGQRLGITKLPALWLVDRNGLLRDLHAEANLVEKVRTLLGE